jgi:hypothetical protein
MLVTAQWAARKSRSTSLSGVGSRVRAIFCSSSSTWWRSSKKRFSLQLSPSMAPSASTSGAATYPQWITFSISYGLWE